MTVRSLRLSLNPQAKTALHHAHTLSVPSQRRLHLQPSRRPLNDQTHLFQHLLQYLLQHLHHHPPLNLPLCRHLLL